MEESTKITNSTKHLRQTKLPNNLNSILKTREGESLSEYLAELHCLTKHFDYRDQLEDMLRDRLVHGIKHECI